MEAWPELAHHIICRFPKRPLLLAWRIRWLKIISEKERRIRKQLPSQGEKECSSRLKILHLDCAIKRARFAQNLDKPSMQRKKDKHKHGRLHASLVRIQMKPVFPKKTVVQLKYLAGFPPPLLKNNTSEMQEIKAEIAWLIRGLPPSLARPLMFILDAYKMLLLVHTTIGKVQDPSLSAQMRQRRACFSALCEEFSSRSIDRHDPDSLIRYTEVVSTLLPIPRRGHLKRSL